jgi:hypothetical protein
MFGFLLCFALAVPQAERGFLRRELSELVKSEFFTTYKLAEVRRRSSGEFSQVVFQPTGPHRDQVRLFIRVNGEGETRIVDAALNRSFIDSPAAAAARDFVRALLRDGVPRGDHADIDTLVTELAGGPLERGSRAYEVVAGRQAAVTVPGTRTRVTLANVGEGAARVLRISLHRAGPARD